MKNIIITTKGLKQELKIWLVCLIAANGLNIYSIIHYQTSWSELYSQGGFVVLISLFIYSVLWIFRGVFLLVRYVVRLKVNRV
jgi:hypothetical protein